MGWPQSVVLQDALQLDKLIERTRVHTRAAVGRWAWRWRCGR